MSPRLARLQPYPFEKLRALLAGVSPNPAFKPIDLSIGEPKHPTPDFIKAALAGALDGLAVYPATAGIPELRAAIGQWLERRYGLPPLDPATEVLPVNGSREALFSFAQALLDGSAAGVRVACPNPFYQIYEGAALLAGASPAFLNAGAARGYRLDPDGLAESTWREVRLLYACSPANPGGSVLRLEEWARLFELADAHGFVIASDECYSEIYLDEARPPLGALEAARRLGRDGYRNLVVFSSLSKRSNVPGMRSGFVAGDARLLRAFVLYRTYHGSAMSLAVQRASIAAWGDEAHVRENRRLYAERFAAALPRVQPPLSAYAPEGGFYLWMRVPIDDTEFAWRLVRDYNVRVLPGSYLAREAHGENPGSGHVRVALVAPLADCLEAIERIGEFARRL
jgi:N-succinyldiaminopimelate aminotransferase